MPSSPAPRHRLALSAAAATLGLVSGVTALPRAGCAAAFYLQDQSVRGLGRAYSGEVADTGPASLWWNPASIAGSPLEVYGGLNGLVVGSSVTDQGSSITRPVPPAGLTTPVGGSSQSRGVVENGLIPNFALAVPLSPKLDVGVLLAAPFDFTSQYGQNSFARYDGLTSRLATGDLQLTAAYRLTSWLDVGAGFDTEYTHAYLTQASPNLSPLLADGQTALRGSGWNYGFVAGARAHGSRWSLGASYRSSMAHDLDGPVSVSGLVGPLAGADFSTRGTAHFRTPWITTLGGRFALTPQLWIDGQVQRFGWSRFSGIDVSYPGGGETIVTDYRDTTSGAIGFDYQALPHLVLRAGFGYDQTPTRNQDRSALVPDSDRQLYTVGATYQASPRMKLDFGLGYIAFDGSRVNNTEVFYPGTAAATAATIVGRVAGQAEEFSAGVRYQF